MMRFVSGPTLVFLVALFPFGPAAIAGENGVVTVADQADKTTDEDGFLLHLEPLPSELETSKDFDSKPVGRRQKWQFDTGYFDFDDRQSGLIPPGDDTQNYSGIRLRRPTGN